MHRRSTIPVALILAGCLLAACAGAPRLPSSDEPLVVAEPANLTGRPLRALDLTFYSADSIPMTKALGADSGKIDFIAALQLALERQLAEARDGARSGEGEPRAATWRIQPVMLDWDASRLSRDGELTVRASLIAIAPDGEAAESPAIEVIYALLDAAPTAGIAGGGRDLAGRHEGLAWLLASRLIAAMEAGR